MDVEKLLSVANKQAVDRLEEIGLDGVLSFKIGKPFHDFTRGKQRYWRLELLDVASSETLAEVNLEPTDVGAHLAFNNDFKKLLKKIENYFLEFSDEQMDTISLCPIAKKAKAWRLENKKAAARNFSWIYKSNYEEEKS